MLTFYLIRSMNSKLEFQLWWDFVGAHFVYSKVMKDRCFFFSHAQNGINNLTSWILTLNLPAVHPSRDMNYLTWITLKDKSLSTELLGSTKRRWRWCWRPDKSRHTCGVSGLKNYGICLSNLTNILLSKSSNQYESRIWLIFSPNITFIFVKKISTEKKSLLD